MKKEAPDEIGKENPATMTCTTVGSATILSTLGVTGLDGRCLGEGLYPETTSYGHNTPDAKRNALIIDGMFSKDRLQWFCWQGSKDSAPKLEPICLHNTAWGSLPGQYSHPHPLTDAAGKWVSFTSARSGRSDVLATDIESQTLMSMTR